MNTHAVRRLLVSLSALALLIAAMPAGCGSQCEPGGGGCADDTTVLKCIGGEGFYHWDPSPCPTEQRCQEFSSGEVRAGECVASSEGGPCTTFMGCTDGLLCVRGACGDPPPELSSACTGAVSLDVPAPDVAPGGATLDTTFEPVPPVASPALGLDVHFLSSDLCGSMPQTGRERLVNLKIPTLPTMQAMPLQVTVSAKGAPAGSMMSLVFLGQCDNPRSADSAACVLAGTPLQTSPILNVQSGETRTVLLQLDQAPASSIPVTLQAKLLPSQF